MHTLILQSRLAKNPEDPTSDRICRAILVHDARLGAAFF
jgi:hypothetical protein